MAHIEWSPTTRENVICLSRKEASALYGPANKLAGHYQSLAEKYRDIIDGGEATVRQQTAWIRYDELADLWAALAAQLKTFGKEGRVF